MHLRYVCFILSVFILSCSELKDETVDIPRVSITQEGQWLNDICSSKYKGRRAGTEECDSVSAFISNELALMGYKVFSQCFRFKDAFDLQNVYVYHKGTTDSLIVIGAHYDGAVYGKSFPAADDNGSGVVALLSICKALEELSVPHSKTLLLAFWAAEENTLGSAFNGSDYFINHFEFKDLVEYYCNIDCFANKDQGIVFYFSPGNDMVGKRMSHLLLSDEMSKEGIIIKQNTKFNSDYVPFYKSGVPYFGWNDIDPSGYVHSPRDNPESISLEKIITVVNLTLKIVLSL